MKQGRALSVALVGLSATLVEVETAVGGGLPRTVIVGLPDTALTEARERCRAAVAHLGHPWPSQLVTVNLSPASLPKRGSHYDVAIVASVLAAEDLVPDASLAGTVLVGELALDGRVRPARGLLPVVLEAQRSGCRRVIVPAPQVAEGRLVTGIEIIGVETLAELVGILRGEPAFEHEIPILAADPEVTPDLADVAGQIEARWAIEVAAAGGHHLFLHGPPGVGKTLLAERLPGVLPPLSDEAALEVSALRSIAGGSLASGLVRRAPFSAPHHTASVASLVGGGARIARPGAVSLAHHGVLFLDEAPEFSPRALEALRTPLESGVMVLARSEAQTTYPARFQLVLAANPCPCGLRGSSAGVCSCSAMAVRRYAERLSGPILDRIDVRCQLRPMTQSYLRAAAGRAECSAVVAERVLAARERQRHRLAPRGWETNAAVPGPYLRRELPLPDGIEVLESAVARGQLSARGVDKVLKVAWTLADLAERDRPAQGDLLAALAMRRGERGEEAVDGGA
ncbi:MAG: YifB family Mg chelatase-like AAA ATPase [Propioniciclava sp.]